MPKTRRTFTPEFKAKVALGALLDRMVHFAELFRVEIRAYCVTELSDSVK